MLNMNLLYSKPVQPAAREPPAAQDGSEGSPTHIRKLP